MRMVANNRLAISKYLRYSEIFHMFHVNLVFTLMCIITLGGLPKMGIPPNHGVVGYHHRPDWLMNSKGNAIGISAYPFVCMFCSCFFSEWLDAFGDEHP